MNNVPSNHHYISQCYLKQFANHQRQLWKKKKDGINITRCTTAQICYEKDAFKIRTNETLSINSISDKNHIELHSFKKQENNYGKNIAQILKYSNAPTVIDKNAYSLFLETLVTIKRRNPFTRTIIVNSLLENIQNGTYKSELKKGILEDGYNENLNFDIDTYLEQHVQNTRNNDDKMHDMYLSTFIDINEDSMIKLIAKQLYGCKQIILHAPIGGQFITSDNPGVTINSNVTRSFGGFGEPFKFIYPLSPNACLLIDSLRPEQKSVIEKSIYHTVVNNCFVDKTNELTKKHSTTRIFGFSKESLL